MESVNLFIYIVFTCPISSFKTLVLLASFSYDTPGVPLSCKMVDFQVITVRSPTADLARLFFTSCNPSVIKHISSECLNTYYSMFSDVVKAAGLPVPFTVEELIEDMKMYSVKALCGAIHNLPSIFFVTDIVEMEGYMEGSAAKQAELTEIYQKEVLNRVHNDDLIRSRYCGLMDIWNIFKVQVS